MDKQQLLAKIDKAWLELKASYAALSEDEMTASGAAGAWSIKDTLAHITTWEEEALKYLPLILDGRTPPRYSVQYGGIDAFNDMMTERKRALSLAETLAQLDDVHARLRAYLAGAPDAQFTRETRFRRRIRLDTYSHYPHHTEMIRMRRQGVR